MTVVRDQNTWNAVMSSPLLTVPMQQIYWALWQKPEGSTKGELEQFLKASNVQPDPSQPWDKQVGVMVKMGLVSRGNKRHCPVKNKEDVIWLLTASAAPIKPRANKPSAKRYEKAVKQFEHLLVQHEAMGDGMVTPELRLLYEWCKDKM